MPDFSMNISCVLKELEKSVQLPDEEINEIQQDSNPDPILSTPNEESTYENFGSHAISTFSPNGISIETIVLLHIFVAYFGTIF